MSMYNLIEKCVDNILEDARLSPSYLQPAYSCRISIYTGGYHSRMAFRKRYRSRMDIKDRMEISKEWRQAEKELENESL